MFHFRGLAIITGVGMALLMLASPMISRAESIGYNSSIVVMIPQWQNVEVTFTGVAGTSVDIVAAGECNANGDVDPRFHVIDPQGTEIFFNDNAYFGCSALGLDAAGQGIGIASNGEYRIRLWRDQVVGGVTLSLTCVSGPCPEGGVSGGEFKPIPNIPLCAALDNPSAGVVWTEVTPQTAGDGLIYCREVTNMAQIGNQEVINMGIIHAVDLVPLDPDNRSIIQFAAPMTVCLQGEGTLVFLDATRAPRTLEFLRSVKVGDSMCAQIPNAGTIILVSAPPPRKALEADTCHITTADIIRLRTEPRADAGVISFLPSHVTLEAVAFQSNWFGIQVGDQVGWVSADYVTSEGSCL